MQMIRFDSKRLNYHSWIILNSKMSTSRFTWSHFNDDFANLCKFSMGLFSWFCLRLKIEKTLEFPRDTETKRKQLKISNKNEKTWKENKNVRSKATSVRTRKKKKFIWISRRKKRVDVSTVTSNLRKKIPHLLQFPSVSRHKKNKLKNIRSPPTDNRDVILTPFATSKVFQPTLKYSTHALIKKRFLFIRQHATQQQAQQYCV